MQGTGPSRQFLAELLVAVTAAATVEVLKEERADILGSFQRGSFELYLLWSLCVLLLLTRVAAPFLKEWWKNRHPDWDDFRALETDARSVRHGYLHDRIADLPKEKRAETVVEEHDLKIHLRLLRVGFYSGENGRDVVTDMALLIKLMQRRDLRTARRMFPFPAEPNSEQGRLHGEAASPRGP